MVAWDIGSPEGYEWFIGWLFLLLFCVGVCFFFGERKQIALQWFLAWLYN